MKSIPSFADGKLAVTPQTNKKDVLEKMQVSNRDWLPVVSAQRHFLGVVSLSQLTASMILDVTKQLQQER